MPAMSRDAGDDPTLPDTRLRPIVVEIFDEGNTVEVTQRLQAFPVFPPTPLSV